MAGEHIAVEDQIRRVLPPLAQESVTELAQMVERLVSAFHPDRIYAFGSQARGEAGPESDLDLLIVVPHASEPAHRLAQAAYHALPVHSLPIDILVMSRDEFERRSRAASSLPRPSCGRAGRSMQPEARREADEWLWPLTR